MLDISRQQTYAGLARLTTFVQRPGPTPEVEQTLKRVDPRWRTVLDKPSGKRLADYVVATNGQQTLFIYGGTDKVDQAIAYTLSALQGARYLEGGFYIEQFYDFGVSVVEEFHSLRIEGGKDYVFVGHSYGGAAAECAAHYVESRYPSFTVSVLSFGAPRCTVAGSWGFRIDTRAIRLAGRNDPVPTIPPDSSELVEFSAALAKVYPAFTGATEDAYRAGRAWAFAHPCQAVTFGNPGRLVPFPNDLDPSLFGELLGSLQARSGGAAAFSGHDMMTYTLLAERGLPVGYLIDNIETEPDTAPRIQEVISMAALTYKGPQFPLVPKEWRAKAQRIGSEYWVVLNSRKIIQTFNLSRGRTQARHLNRWLRALLACGAFVGDTFSTALSEWALTASTPGTGFRPTLNLISA